MSSKCRANMNPDKHPVKNSMVNSKMIRISPWLLHMTINAISIMYAETPTDDNRFSAINTSLNVPSVKTNANIHPTAKKHKTTSQYILEINDCKSRSFINSYTVSDFIFPDSMSD